MGYQTETFHCTILEKEDKSPVDFLIVVGVVFPFIIMAVCYALIFYKVLRLIWSCCPMLNQGRPGGSVPPLMGNPVVAFDSVIPHFDLPSFICKVGAANFSGPEHGSRNTQGHGERGRSFVGRRRLHQRGAHRRAEREAAHAAPRAGVDADPPAHLPRLLCLGRDSSARMASI